MDAQAAVGTRVALLAGATGLVGREILQGLLADPAVSAVHALARRPLALQHPKLAQHVVDFAALPPLPPVHEAYLALGTTLKVAGSQSAFRAVDFDAALAVARAARAAGATRLGVVSAMGADARSRVFYSCVKGELEEALAGLGYDGLVIARPSLLAGDRGALGQPKRFGEEIGLELARWLRPVLPANVRPIRAADVARALLRSVPNAAGLCVLDSGRMQASP